jgi:hypothetical protein
LLAGKQHWLFLRNRAFSYSAVFSICASFWACRILPQINAPRNPQVQTDPLPPATTVERALRALAVRHVWQPSHGGALVVRREMRVLARNRGAVWIATGPEDAFLASKN